MFNAKRGTALVLVLAFLFIVGFSAPSRADDPGTVINTFMTRLLNGQSVWNMLTAQSQEVMVQMALMEAGKEKSLEGVDTKELEAFVRRELADNKSEMSKALWSEVKKSLAGTSAADVAVKNVKVNGDTADAVFKDGSVMKMFKEGGSWKVGLMESMQ